MSENEFRREMAELLIPGVITVIHKSDIQDDPEVIYAWLVDFLRRSLDNN
ncbi:MAG: hypothetical protein AAGD25_15995 [Cyanobacteria bacterium P01_F01_bin.150]